MKIIYDAIMIFMMVKPSVNDCSGSVEDERDGKAMEERTNVRQLITYKCKKLYGLYRYVEVVFVIWS